MIFSRGFAAMAAACLIMGFAAPASAFIEGKMLDPYYGSRALDGADPSGGPIAPDIPVQADLEEEFDIDWDGYKITAVQGFGIEAVVLGRQDYKEGDMGALVPIDLALGWGKMSDPEWVKYLRVSQDDRVYRWSYPRGTPLDQKTVEVSSANMHIMPSSPEILDKFKSVGKGDVVQISGFLVDISNEDGFEWKTSRVRTDIGRGACELILVTDISIRGR